MRTPLLETCLTRYLLADGAISTSLVPRPANGEPPAIAAETLCADDPEKVLALHRAFADAGADIITTNSFSANATRLTALDADACAHLCTEAARLARTAAGPERWVLGTVGPWYASGDNWEDALTRQVRALADGGVDAIYLETATSLEAAHAMVNLAASHDSNLPVIISFAFNKVGSDKFALPGDGATLADVAAQLGSLATGAAAPPDSAPASGAAGFGLNCGKGLDIYDYVALVSAFRAATDKCIMARPPAGRDDIPEVMAQGVWGLVRAGANIIGGCCGATPEHIAAFRQELDMLG